MRKSFLFLIFIYLSIDSKGQDQNQEALSEIKKFQDELNQEYKDPDESPLEPSERKKFKRHDFFASDLKFRVNARLDRNVDNEIFQMKTSTTRLAKYRKYAIASFQISGQEFRLTIYQSIDLMSKPEYKDHLFLPFTDNTTGESTYGGGRYLDLKIIDGNDMTIDFNKAYNPYCAYSNRYSCPKVPEENNLPVEILAGVRYNDKH